MPSPALWLAQSPLQWVPRVFQLELSGWNSPTSSANCINIWNYTCASVSIRAPFWGTWRDAPFLGPLREGWIFFLSRELSWGIQETCKRSLFKWATLSIGAPVGDPGGGSFTRTFERQMEGSGNRASLVKLTLNWITSTIVASPSNARNANIYSSWPLFGNSDSPLFLSDCTVSQHWMNHESSPVSYLCVNT